MMEAPSTNAAPIAPLPPATLIICSRNRPQLLWESVESVLQGDEVPSELIVMDQSNEAHPILSTLTQERGCQIRYERTKTLGECPAKNIAIQLADHDILVFTDDDVIVLPNWYGTLVRALVDGGEHSVVTGQVRPGEAQTPDGFAPTIMLDEAPAVYEGRPGEDVLFPMNMAMYRLAFETVGLFDERLGAGGPFPGAEDNDFGMRLLEAGFRIVYVPQASLYHRAWRTAEDYLPLRWSYGFGQGAFYAKHLGFKDRYMLRRMWADVWRHAYRFVRYPLVRSRRQTAADGLYVLGVLYGAAKWLITQRKIS